MLKEHFQIAGGSIVGRLHIGQDGVLIGKNNQDALRLFSNDELFMAVICDGCGSEPYSEFGAQLGADLLVSSTRRRLERSELDCDRQRSTAFWELVRQDVLAQMRVLGLTIAGLDSFTETVRQRFLFTAIIALVTDQVTQIVSIGDGLYALNGKVTRLGPFPDNKPPYLAYGLIDTEFSTQPDLFCFGLQAQLPTCELTSLLIGSDGVGDFIANETRLLPGKKEALGALAQFWQHDLFLRNRDAIRRRLVLANSERTTIDRANGRASIHNGLLPDDTTVAVVRRIPK